MLASLGNLQQQLGQVVKSTLTQYEKLPEEQKRQIEAEAQAREIYDKIKNNLINLDWQKLSEFDENLSLITRIVADYHFREALARNSEELQKLGEKFKQLGENVAKGHAVVGGIVASLVALGTISAGLGTVIGGILALGAGLIEPAKAISMSGERMDDLGHRIDRIRNTKGKLTENIYWKGLELLHSRPKCRALTSSCAREHLYKTAEVDLFNKAYEVVLDFYDKFTFDKFKELYNLQKIQQQAQTKQEIVGAVIETQAQTKTNIILIAGLGAVALITLLGKK